MARPNIPDEFTVELFSSPRPGLEKFVVAWRDEEANRKYHVLVHGTDWQGVIHSNWIDCQGQTHYKTHRELSAFSDRWRPIIDGLKRRAAEGGLFAKAVERAMAENEAMRAQALKEEAAKMRSALMTVAEAANDDGKIDDVARLCVQIAELSQDSLIRLSRIIRAA